MPRTPWLTAALIAGACGGNAFGQAKFIPLGDLPGGAFKSAAYGLSGDGLVVVGNGTTAKATQAFRWTAQTGMVSIGSLSEKDPESMASATNEDGSVVVGRTKTVTGDRPFRWTADTGLVALEDSAGVGWGSAAAVNPAGTVVVGNYGHLQAGDVEAFRWTADDALVPLGKAGKFQCGARGVSGDGGVIIGVAGDTDAFEAVRWTPRDGWIGLGDLPGGPFCSFAHAVTPDGSVIVGSGDYGKWGSSQQAFRWTAETGMVGLGDLPGISLCSTAQAVNADGSVIVGRGSGPDYPQATIWTQASGMVSLRDRLIAQGATGLENWWLDEAMGISDDGRIIVGLGYNASGNQEAWLAILSEPCHADCDWSNSLDIDDFICFQSRFATGDMAADCDKSGSLDFDDFLCFQAAFAAGCP